MAPLEAAGAEPEVLARLSTFDLSFNFFTLTTSNVRQLALYLGELNDSQRAEEWQRAVEALVEGAFKDIDAKELARHALCRETKREWSVAA